MPRFKNLAEIQKLMSSKEQIRNMGIIAHIDHGKTTLADTLLAGTGLLSPRMAGSARVLDYLEEEQKRKITVKTANISLVYKNDNASFLINLVDTPGHVDFTGKVTRALRAIDGVVVIVDAVEEIMAQTEIVARQALAERVKPVLFINKVDRLINELHLTAEQIEQKFNRIIGRFNDLIELYGEEQFKDEWKIDPQKGNVTFGSALHGWGFTLDLAKKQAIKFSDVVNAYKNSDQESLRKNLPVYRAIFEMAIVHLPNPKKAQEYRVDRVWSGPRFSKVGKAIAECSDDKPTVMSVTNVQPSASSGSLTTARLFSGTAKKGDKLHCVSALSDVEVNQVYLYMGSLKEEIEQANAGNIAVLDVSKVLTAGETLVDIDHKAGMVPFESVRYVSEPVITVGIEPKNPKDIIVLMKALHRLTTEDPSLSFSVDKQTGEFLLSAMGELHLEVGLNQLKQIASNIIIAISSPRVVYRESVKQKGIIAKVSTSNKKNIIEIQVEPEEEELANPLCLDQTSSALIIDEQRNVMVDCAGKTESIQRETLEAIVAGFEFACKGGPLCGEPMRHIRVNLVDLQIIEDEKEIAKEIMHAVGKAVFGSFLTAKPALLEPIYKTIITTPTELAGECSRILETKRGKVSSFEQKGLTTVITGHIPVSETFSLSKEIRSATSGRVFWQNILDIWKPVPDKLAKKVITQIRVSKGLSPEVPPPEKFMDGQQN